MHENQFHTGSDYFNAALIPQHGNTPGDYLLTHEICVVALCVESTVRDAMFRDYLCVLRADC